MDHLPDRQQQADLHAEMERVSSNMVDALLEGTPRKGHTTAQQQIAQQQAQQHQAGPEAAEALQQHADAGPTAAYHLQGTDFANLGPVRVHSPAPSYLSEDSIRSAPRSHLGDHPPEVAGVAESAAAQAAHQHQQQHAQRMQLDMQQQLHQQQLQEHMQQQQAAQHQDLLQLEQQQHQQHKAQQQQHANQHQAQQFAGSGYGDAQQDNGAYLDEQLLNRVHVDATQHPSSGAMTERHQSSSPYSMSGHQQAAAFASAGNIADQEPPVGNYPLAVSQAGNFPAGHDQQPQAAYGLAGQRFAASHDHATSGSYSVSGPPPVNMPPSFDQRRMGSYAVSGPPSSSFPMASREQQAAANYPIAMPPASAFQAGQPYPGEQPMGVDYSSAAAQFALQAAAANAAGFANERNGFKDAAAYHLPMEMMHAAHGQQAGGAVHALPPAGALFHTHPSSNGNMLPPGAANAANAALAEQLHRAASAQLPPQPPSNPGMMPARNSGLVEQLQRAASAAVGAGAVLPGGNGALAEHMHRAASTAHSAGGAGLPPPGASLAEHMQRAASAAHSISSSAPILPSQAGSLAEHMQRSTSAAHSEFSDHKSTVSDLGPSAALGAAAAAASFADAHQRSVSAGPALNLHQQAANAELAHQLTAAGFLGQHALTEPAAGLLGLQPAQAYADVAARLEPPMQPAASNASSISISSKGKPPEPAGQLTAAQAEKLRKEVARLTAETERLEKEVQRQKTLRETERIEFLEAKEKLKHGWATDRDDFARVKDQLKKKNAEHHLQNGRLSQSLKESEAIARSLREVCQRHNIPIPPHLREGVPAQSTSRPGSPVRGTSGEQAATQLGLEDALQAQMQLSGHGTAGPGLLPPATAVGVPATLAQQVGSAAVPAGASSAAIVAPLAAAMGVPVPVSMAHSAAVPAATSGVPDATHAGLESDHSSTADRPSQALRLPAALVPSAEPVLGIPASSCPATQAADGAFMPATQGAPAATPALQAVGQPSALVTGQPSTALAQPVAPAAVPVHLPAVPQMVAATPLDVAAAATAVASAVQQLPTLLPANPAASASGVDHPEPKPLSADPAAASVAAAAAATALGQLAAALAGQIPDLQAVTQPLAVPPISQAQATAAGHAVPPQQVGGTAQEPAANPATPALDQLAAVLAGHGPAVPPVPQAAPPQEFAAPPLNSNGSAHNAAQHQPAGVPQASSSQPAQQTAPALAAPSSTPTAAASAAPAPQDAASSTSAPAVGTSVATKDTGPVSGNVAENRNPNTASPQASPMPSSVSRATSPGLPASDELE